jgi:hypothetical protein
MCGPLENKASCKTIIFCSFAPMEEEEDSVYKNMKINNEEMRLQ